MGDRLRDQAAVITGAGSGIGRACAMRFAAEGAGVVVSDVDGERASVVAKEIEADGGVASAFRCDVSDVAQVEALIDICLERHGQIDTCINNAASTGGGSIGETSDALWRQVHAVTLDGTFYGVRAALRAMCARGRGSIINISSGAGLGAEPGLGAYGAAKAAVINLTKTAAVENAATGVRVNCIAPGPIATPGILGWLETWPGGRAAFQAQIPARRMGEPEEIAGAALFLASDDASFVTGSVLVVDGGVAAQLASPRPPTPRA